MHYMNMYSFLNTRALPYHKPRVAPSAADVTRLHILCSHTSQLNAEVSFTAVHVSLNMTACALILLPVRARDILHGYCMTVRSAFLGRHCNRWRCLCHENAAAVVSCSSLHCVHPWYNKNLLPLGCKKKKKNLTPASKQRNVWIIATQ